MRVSTLLVTWKDSTSYGHMLKCMISHLSMIVVRVCSFPSLFPFPFCFLYFDSVQRSTDRVNHTCPCSLLWCSIPRCGWAAPPICNDQSHYSSPHKSWSPAGKFFDPIRWISGCCPDDSSHVFHIEPSWEAICLLLQLYTRLCSYWLVEVDVCSILADSASIAWYESRLLSHVQLWDILREKEHHLGVFEKSSNRLLLPFAYVFYRWLHELRAFIAIPFMEAGTPVLMFFKIFTSCSRMTWLCMLSWDLWSSI